jgi:hypothetical protein
LPLQRTTAAGSGECLGVTRQTPRSGDKALYAAIRFYAPWIHEPDYCLTKLVWTQNYSIVRHNSPLALEEDAIFIVRDIPFTVRPQVKEESTVVDLTVQR